ncbi:MAG: DUF5658 family protein [Haloarculaceae archaeon]
MGDLDRAWYQAYWSWVAGALYLLVTLDLLTTFFAVAELGLAAEVNPLMVWAVDRGLIAVLVLNLGSLGLASGMAWGIARTVEQTPPAYRRWYARVIELWIGLLVSAGLVVFANNLAVIVLGESLL